MMKTITFFLPIALLTSQSFAQPTFTQVYTRSAGTTDAFFGSDLSVGRANNDAYDDVLVSAAPAGQVYLFLGGPGGLAPTPAVILTVLPQSNPNIPQPVLLRDLNGDGRADILVGQPQAGLGLATNAGQVLVYFNTGDPPFFNAQPDATLRPAQSQQGGRFGWSVDVGDVDGDGAPDIVVGEPRVDLSFVGPGLANVFYGPVPSGFPMPDLSLAGAHDDDGFGYVVAVAQVLGDFRRDLAVASPFFRIFNNNPNITGRVQVFAGTAAGVSATPAATITDPCPAGSAFGRVMALGDVDGNSAADLVVGSAFMGADCNTFPGTVPNRIHVFLSSGTAVSAASAATLNVPAFSGNAAVLEPQLLVADLNSDNRADVLAGARTATVGAAGNAGHAYLFLGSASPPGVNSSPLQVLTKTNPNDNLYFGTSLAVGNIHGNDAAEIIVGATAGFGGGGAGQIIVFSQPPFVAAKEREILQGIRIMPNPASHLAFVSFEGSLPHPLLVSVCDFSGKIVYERVFDKGNEPPLEMPLFSIPPGIYAVHFRCHGETTTQKLHILK